MKSFVCVSFVVIVLALFSATKGYSEEELEYTPHRHSSQYGAKSMFSSPRIGRSDPTLMNNLHETEAWLNDLYATLSDEYEEYPRSDATKRANYFSLPRVGRSDPEMQKFANWLQQTLNKRAAKPYAGARIWDNPRTGKRSLDAYAQKVEVEAKPMGLKEQL